MKRFTQRTRALDFIVIIGIFLAAYQVFIHPRISELATNHTELEILKIEKERLMDLISQQDLIQRQLVKLRKLELQSGYYLASPSVDVAVQQLIDRISAIVVARGGDIIGTGLLSRGAQGHEIKVHFHLTGNEDILIRLLHELEGGQPLIIIDNLIIRSIVSGSDKRTDPHQRGLDIQLDIEGFRRWKEA
jgi:hypothetical protein